jgi:hypothetical protein
MKTPGATHAIRPVAAFAVLAALLWTPGPASGQTQVGAEAVQKYNANPLVVAIPSSLKPQDLEEVMALAFIGRKWTVVERSPQAVVGTLDHRGFKAKATLKVDGNVVKILNDSLYQSNESGKLEPAVPRGWLRNLEKDLTEYMATKAAGRK